MGVGYSFTDWSSRSAIDGTHFVGLKNYIEIFTSDTDYASGILHTLMFTVVSNIVKLIPALLLAVMLQEGLRGKGIYTVLEALNLEFLQQKWLSDLDVVWKSIFGVDAWRGIGYCMTIFLAGLQTIPKSLYEAAKIDGANFWQRLRYITLPMLSGAVMINLVFGITYGLKVFDIVYVLTNGGPGHATEVLTTYSFQLYSTGNYGMSTALNAILLLITAVIGIVVVRTMSKREVQQ